MMDITINGEKQTIEAGQATISDLLKLKNVDMPDMVSVEHNGTILERAAFDTTQVAAGDEVEFLYFMGGGSHNYDRLDI
jgi:sulfur carrier protein